MDGRFMGNSTVEPRASGLRNGIRTDACYKQYFQFASLDTTGAWSVKRWELLLQREPPGSQRCIAP